MLEHLKKDVCEIASVRRGMAYVNTNQGIFLPVMRKAAILLLHRPVLIAKC